LSSVGTERMKFNLHRCLVVAISAAIVAGCAAVHAQSNEPTYHSDTFAIRIAMEKQTLLAGQPPKVRLTTKNLTDHLIPAPGDRCGSKVRVWVQGELGEPPTTPRERDATGRRLPGDQSFECTVVADMPPLAPGESTTRTFDLEYLYDLQVPGKYTVYLEVPSPEGWLHTNTVTFQIMAGELPTNKSNP
jgi:hypothetical protein